MFAHSPATCFENTDTASKRSGLALISSELEVEQNFFLSLAFQLILQNPRITLAFVSP